MSRQLALTPSALRVTLRLAAAAPGWQYRDMAASLGMAPSALHKAVARAQLCGLLDGRRVVRRHALDEFCRHGARYAFAGEAVLKDVADYLEGSK